MRIIGSLGFVGSVGNVVVVGNVSQVSKDVVDWSFDPLHFA